jgi:hypothetical protein
MKIATCAKVFHALTAELFRGGGNPMNWTREDVSLFIARFSTGTEAPATVAACRIEMAHELIQAVDLAEWETRAMPHDIFETLDPEIQANIIEMQAEWGIVRNHRPVLN